MILLSEERLEFAELVRNVTIGPLNRYQLEVMAEVVQVPLHLWLLQWLVRSS